MIKSEEFIGLFMLTVLIGSVVLTVLCLLNGLF